MQDAREGSGERRATGSEPDLVKAAQAGHEWAHVDLVHKYQGLICGKARLYYLAGADRDDVIQEGMIGLFKAVRDFDPGRQTSFRSFAEICITRQIISAVKAHTRHKHAVLNGAVSLSAPTVFEEGDQVLSDILTARDLCDPAQEVMDAWESSFICAGMARALSSFEHDVLVHYVRGCSYADIAVKLGRREKAVDNAIQRIRAKMTVQIERCRAC